MIENPMVSGLAAEQHRREAEERELRSQYDLDRNHYVAMFLAANSQADVGRLSHNGSRRLRQTLAESVSDNLCDLRGNALHDIISIVAQCADGNFAELKGLQALALGVVTHLALEHAEAMQQ